MSTFYNVGSADISDGLIDYEISSGQDYFILLSAPSNANIQIRLNENTAPLIPIKEHWQFKSADVKKIFISSDAIAGGIIKWGQADGNLEITTNPTINQIDTISQMGVTFAEQMDKIVNPYDLENIEILQGNSNVASRTTVLNTVLDCDKIVFSLNGGISANEGELIQDGRIELRIGADIVATTGGRNLANYAISKSQDITQLEGVRGKTLTIVIDNELGLYHGYYFIQKYSLKA